MSKNARLQKISILLLFGGEIQAPLSRGYTCDFLLAQVMRFFFKLSRRQRTVKIARVATHEHATRQLK